MNIPKNSYVVVGSGILIALGLKQGTDIDILVTEDIFAEFIKYGWDQIPWTYPDHNSGIFLRRNQVEIYLDVNCGDFKPTTKELIERSTLINDVNFACMEDTLSFKKEYVKTKTKHKADIEIIEKYLENNLK